MNSQYLFFDIDGTLISNKDKKLPDSTKEALCMARQRGHKIFINTGRTYTCLPPILKEGFDGYLCGCGTNLFLDGKEVIHIVFSAKVAKEIVASAVKHGVYALMEGRDKVYFSEGTLDTAKGKRIYDIYQEQNTPVVLCDENTEMICSKLCIISKEDSDLEGFFMPLREEFDIIDRGDYFYEIVPKGFSKSTAMQEVLKYYGAKLEDTWAFGDSSNDLPMFQFAKHTVLMGEHDVVLEQYAEYIADTVEQDGLYKIMKETGLILSENTSR